MAFIFITIKSAKFFKFTGEYLTNLYFYNYFQLSLIYSDFLKGLRAVVIV
jgi:hypothetical protein